eukprot:1159633-Pelagomonas_calceolata.AAC.3
MDSLVCSRVCTWWQHPSSLAESASWRLRRPCCLAQPRLLEEALQALHCFLSPVGSLKCWWHLIKAAPSAPAVASYVANALESGVTWPRIERFFLSSVEADPGIGAIRVQVKGRLGWQGKVRLELGDCACQALETTAGQLHFQGCTSKEDCKTGRAETV